MPMRPLKPCGRQPCRNLVRKGNCADHGGEHATRKAYESGRPSAAARGYNTPEWQALRKQVLEEEPLCMCEVHLGALDAPASTDVDHIKPHNGPEDPLFWDRRNLQGRAHACHSRKTASRDGGFGNPVRR